MEPSDEHHQSPTGRAGFAHVAWQEGAAPSQDGMQSTATRTAAAAERRPGPTRMHEIYDSEGPQTRGWGCRRRTCCIPCPSDKATMRLVRDGGGPYRPVEVYTNLQRHLRLIFAQKPIKLCTIKSNQIPKSTRPLSFDTLFLLLLDVQDQD